VSALTPYPGGLAALAAVMDVARYVVLAAAAVTLVWLAALGVAVLVGRRRPARGPGERPAGCGPLVPSARRAPDDLTV
jgi:hypothetical protein